MVCVLVAWYSYKGLTSAVSESSAERKAKNLERSMKVAVCALLAYLVTVSAMLLLSNSHAPPMFPPHMMQMPPMLQQLPHAPGMHEMPEAPTGEGSTRTEWLRFFQRDPDALAALQNGDTDALMESPSLQRHMGEVLKLWLGMSDASKQATRRHLETLRDATGLTSGADPSTVAAAKTWSDVFTKRVVVPSLFLQQVENLVSIARDSISGMKDEYAAESDIEGLLEGVDMDLGDLGEADAEPLDVVSKLLPQLKEWAQASGGSTLDSKAVGEYVLEKLAAPTYADILSSMRSTLINVKATYIQSALRKLSETIDTASLEAVIQSSQGLDVDMFEEEMRGIMPGVDASRAQALLEAFSKLLQQSGMADALKLGDAFKSLGGEGGRGSGVVSVSRLIGSELALGMISQLPSAVREDGSIDVGRVAALALKARKAKRPRITGRS
ncbi:hypothetical protein KFL_002980040 [Klebsormidium nitens]|uniref:Uncharacterized protein n=1 Tax=Klebsormidium nitens TaxID=105231 RepID=A0A1Y1I6J9_KLENI|nr:hypothetical protein KFL_002980040 [Klebsormidium nitens]|eukprot:GAQ86580.1 hypothetical protein KFL_002980040 [Klebsormidium nitens]